MERIELHADDSYMIQLDAFVRAICESNHIYNYYATIWVSIAEAVNDALFFEDNGNESRSVEVAFDYCPQGVLFSVRGVEECFNKYDDSLIRVLADKTEVSDSASTLLLTFAVRGIDFGEAASRVSVLNHFYHPALTEVLHV